MWIAHHTVNIFIMAVTLTDRLTVATTTTGTTGKATMEPTSTETATIAPTTTTIAPRTTSTTTTTVTTATAVVTEISECKDLSAPNRPSDCPLWKSLCDDATYYDLMTQQCPLTCNRCPGTGTGPTPTNKDCSDLKRPDGTSNCATTAYLCRDAIYAELMKQQCKRTCGYC